ncbi:MAG: 7-cyano-7-deazaguanine synthase [Deltaproteobacteria bacterium]|nr:7-cyano-7-deazaguanine synthase [Deltaproteobacteria bacterium]
MMSNERVILCGSARTDKPVGAHKPIRLKLWGKDKNVTLKITDITDRMVANLPPRLIDLLEIATYIYCADQATTRGGDGLRDYGSNWRRKFRFHIPVREPDVWSSGQMISILQDTLGFLSEDEYHFHFVKLTDPPPMSLYLDFGSGGASGLSAEEVILFSGGLDSLGGAIQDAVINKKNVALVSHRSSPKIAKRQRELVSDLGNHTHTPPFHVPVWIHKEKELSREFTQRTRSFLYASLGAVVARIFDLWRVRIYENGTISVNLPISEQVIGSRGTRSTHPQAINGFSDLFSALFEKEFLIENPFLWMTKAEVAKAIVEAGCRELIKYSTSCTHIWEMTTLKTHCGVCSQCIDRRFAVLAAGCTDDDDPMEMYSVDLLTGERKPGESRTMLESYVRTAKKIKDITDDGFFSEFPECYRIIGHIRGMKVDEAASKILDLYRRHSNQVFDVITQGIRDHAGEINEGKLPKSCLLILALPDNYKRPEDIDETSREDFRTPMGAAWQDVSIQFKDAHTVSIKVKGEDGIYNYTQMGMVDKRNGNPTKQWDLLYSFAQGHGTMDYDHPDACQKNQKRKEKLAKSLCDFFSIQGDPFRLTDDKKGWRARFFISPD